VSVREELEAWVGLLWFGRCRLNAHSSGDIRGMAQPPRAAALRSGGCVKLTMAVRAERVVAVPHYAQGFRAERASGRPLRAALRAFLEAKLRPAERLSQFLQSRTNAKGVAAIRKCSMGRAPLCDGFAGRLRIVNTGNYVSSITRVGDDEGREILAKRQASIRLVASRASGRGG